MALEDKPMEPAESLQLIQKFMDSARYNVQKSAFGFVFWGILIPVAALLNYFLIRFTAFKMPWLPWPVLAVAGFIFTGVYYGRKYRHKGTASTYGRFISLLFFSGGLTYFLLAFLCVSQEISPVPFMLALTSLLIFVAGMILRFKPLAAGGVLFFLVAIASVFFDPVNQLLLMAISIAVGYLVPGILLMRERQK